MVIGIAERKIQILDSVLDSEKVSAVPELYHRVGRPHFTTLDVAVGSASEHQQAAASQDGRPDQHGGRPGPGCRGRLAAVAAWPRSGRPVPLRRPRPRPRPPAARGPRQRTRRPEAGAGRAHGPENGQRQDRSTVLPRGAGRLQTGAAPGARVPAPVGEPRPGQGGAEDRGRASHVPAGAAGAGRRPGHGCHPGRRPHPDRARERYCAGGGSGAGRHPGPGDGTSEAVVTRRSCRCGRVMCSTRGVRNRYDDGLRRRPGLC